MVGGLSVSDTRHTLNSDFVTSSHKMGYIWLVISKLTPFSFLRVWKKLEAKRSKSYNDRAFIFNFCNPEKSCA